MSVCVVCFCCCFKLLAGWVWVLGKGLSLPHTRHIWEHVVNPSFDCLGSGFKVGVSGTVGVLCVGESCGFPKHVMWNCMCVLVLFHGEMCINIVGLSWDEILVVEWEGTTKLMVLFLTDAGSGSWCLVKWACFHCFMSCIQLLTHYEYWRDSWVLICCFVEFDFHWLVWTMAWPLYEHVLMIACCFQVCVVCRVSSIVECVFA